MHNWFNDHPRAHFITRRFLWTCIVIFIATSLVFFVLRFVPGDPAVNILGETASEEDKSAFRERLNLDKPITEQFYLYWAGIFSGNFGYSYSALEKDTPVLSLIWGNFVPTIELAIAGMIIAIIIAFPLGILSALKQRSWLNGAATVFAFAGVAIPSFWLGPMLIFFFAIKWHILPNPVDDMEGISHLILPSVVLGTALSARLTRMIRSSVLDVLHEDYVRFARSKGLNERQVILKHVLRNALIPVVTVMGLQFAALLTGTIVTEKVFARPGLGTLLIDSIAERNYPVVQGCVVLIAGMYVVMNFIVDVVYVWIDPRIRSTE
jgi:peptide/nickel transport system permease protein